MNRVWRKAFAVLIVSAAQSACRCGSHEEPPRDASDAGAMPNDAAASADAFDAHTAAEVDERPIPGAALTPVISVEEDEDSKEPQVQAHALPALSDDGKLLALYFANHGMTTTSEQSLVIIDVAKRAEVSKLVLVRQGELSELDEDNPTKHTAAIKSRVEAANQVLKKSKWKAPIYKDGSELDLGDEEKQPPIDLGPLRLRVDEQTHTLFLERGDNIVFTKNIKGWSNVGKPISLSDLVLVPWSDTSGLVVLVSSELDGDPNPRRALRLVPFGSLPSPAASASAR